MGTAYTYNSAGLVTFILSNQNGGTGTTLNRDTYTYDPAGNRMTSDSYDGHTFYAYDAADQITGENHNTGYPSFTATYDYDRNGNRLHKTQNGQTDTYTYQPNAYNSQTHTDELQSVSGGITGTKTFGYDANGVARSITTNGSTLYLTADTEDRYTRFDFDTGAGAGRVNAYETYNGMGLRVFRHDAQGRDFPLAYDGASPGSALLSSAQTSFTPGLAQQDSSGQHFYQVDALGSVRGVSDNDQAPQGEVYYDAFGLPSLRQGSTPSPLGFAGAAGYQTDTDTGLMLLGNRYYDSTIGRFLSPDPSGSGDNWYAYCDNDPLDEVDPEGLMGVPTPTGASYGNPFGQMSGSLQASNDLYRSSLYLNKYTRTETTTIWGNTDPNHKMGTTTTTYGPWEYQGSTSLGSYDGYFQLTAGRGNVGHTQGNEELQNEIDQHKASLNQGGYTSKEREVMNKEINNLKNKIKTNEKAAGDRRSRQLMVGVGALGAGYITYRIIRMLPSLFPPLWPTIPINAAAP